MSSYGVGVPASSIDCLAPSDAGDAWTARHFPGCSMSRPSTCGDADLIILGGGCAGLSLAANLADARTSLRVIVVEPRTTYHEDRTWCGWRLVPHAFADCVVASWNRWQVATPAGVIERNSAHYPYEMIRADLFYERAFRAIDRHPAMSFLAGRSAEHLTETANHVEVALSDGSTLSAPWIIDTRPPRQPIERPWLWQTFVGFVVEPDMPAGARFGSVPILMDFQPPDQAVAHFMYILPAGDGRFLCEWTRFSTSPDQLEDIEASLRAWLQEHAGAGWTLHRREQGSLPMALFPADAAGRIVAAGTRGGSLRASTGFAFHAIQRWAASCSASLQATGLPLRPPRNRMLDSMDAIFLEVLHEPSNSAMEVFRRLFEECPPDALVRFLAGMPHSSDLWPIIRSLPWGRFLRAAPSAIRSQMHVRTAPGRYRSLSRRWP